MTTAITRPSGKAPGGVEFLELEITSRCQLTCPSHCYAEAGPTRGHGSLTDEQWRKVIYDAASAGVTQVQFIGGEPTRRPGWEGLVRYALDCGLKVQVYSNLFHVKAAWWPLFEHHRVALATSYYSDRADEHDRVTGRVGSHLRTRANIAEAVRRGIHVQVGIVEVLEGQRVDEARADLESLGVAQVRIDRVRGVGNAARTILPSVSELCGNCTRGRAAIMPDGTVTPCVLGRFLPAGSVTEQPLADILTSRKWAEIAAAIPPRRTPAMAACTPNDSNDCDPASTQACDPAY